MNLGENVTLLQAVIVTVFSMGIVFLVLLGISYILDGFKVFFYKEPKKIENSDIDLEKKVPHESPKGISNEDEEELIAVIATAVAASLSKPVESIRIRNIRPVPQSSSIWAKAGRQELMR